MGKRMCKMMFGYKIKAMHKGSKAMCKIMFGYKIKAMWKSMSKVCISYVQENAQNDVWV